MYAYALCASRRDFAFCEKCRFHHRHSDFFMGAFRFHLLSDALKKYSAPHGRKSEIFDDHKTPARSLSSAKEQMEIPQNAYLSQMSALQGADPSEKDQR